MLRTLEIQDGAVVICGPMATGKTTLAKRIMEESPYRKVCLISGDEICRQLMKKGEDATKAFGRVLYNDVRRAVEDRQMVIIDMALCDIERIAEVMAILTAAGLARTLTLIKMNPDVAQHLWFATQRSDGEPPMWMMLMQSKSFREVLETNLHEIFPWIREYTVDNPCGVRLDFVKSGQMTRNSVSALLMSEETQDFLAEVG